MKRITNEQREQIVRQAIAKRDAFAAAPQAPSGQQAAGQQSERPTAPDGQTLWDEIMRYAEGNAVPTPARLKEWAFQVRRIAASVKL